MDEQPRSVPSRTIAFLAAASFASAASVRACDPILPQIAASFTTSVGAAARVVTVFGVTYACMQLVYGLLADRFGKLETIAVTTLASAATAAFCAFAGSLDLLIFARLLAGGTAAAIIPLSIAWIGDEVDYAARQPVIARFLTGQILGLILGQAMSGIVAEYLGWRTMFLFLAGFFLVSGAALSRELWLRRERAVPVPVPIRQTLIQLGMLIRHRWVLTVLGSAFIEGAALFGGYSFVGADLRARFGLSFDLIGVIVGAFGIGGLIYAAAAPVLVRRLGERGLALAGGCVLFAAFVAIGFVPRALVAAPFTISAGLGFYMLHNTLQTNATQMAPESRSLSIALFAICFFLGQAVGVSLGAPVFDYAGGAPLFLTSGLILMVLAFAFRLALGRR
ncbi:MAG TPA: MFS transporter [Xanthobacteraceae bacterium]|nr:MFS transporter [Xanthobacteraceae bacterium]